MKVKIEVELQVDLADEPPNTAPLNPLDPLERRMMNSAAEAVRNALDFASGEGFSHDMDSITCISVVSVKPANGDHDKGLLVNIFGGSPDQSGGKEESDPGIKSARECMEYLLDSELTSYEESEEDPEHIYRKAEDGLRWINGLYQD